MVSADGEHRATRPAEASKVPTGSDVSKGISAFLSTVLEQLTVTAWLPSMFLVGNGALLLALRGGDRVNFVDAVQRLVDLQWGAIIVLLFAVIIGAMLIQAFDFETLRFWEGYLRSARLRSWSRRRIAAVARRRERLEEQVVLLHRAAFDGARATALDDPRTKPEQLALWNTLEKIVHNRKLQDDERDLLVSVDNLDWLRSAPPDRLHAWDVAKLQLAEYPRPHRLLPTRLGNVMRAAEDRIILERGEDLEGYMIRHIDELPATIVAEHSAYRRRLDMYCSLMFVLAALAVLSAVCLWNTHGWVWRILVPLTYASAIALSYRAAIASALGFGQAVKEASNWVQRQKELPTGQVLDESGTMVP